MKEDINFAASVNEVLRDYEKRTGKQVRYVPKKSWSANEVLVQPQITSNEPVILPDHKGTASLRRLRRQNIKAMRFQDKVAEGVQDEEPVAIPVVVAEPEPLPVRRIGHLTAEPNIALPEVLEAPDSLVGHDFKYTPRRLKNMARPQLREKTRMQKLLTSRPLWRTVAAGLTGLAMTFMVSTNFTTETPQPSEDVPEAPLAVPDKKPFFEIKIDTGESNAEPYGTRIVRELTSRWNNNVRPVIDGASKKAKETVNISQAATKAIEPKTVEAAEIHSSELVRRGFVPRIDALSVPVGGRVFNEGEKITMKLDLKSPNQNHPDYVRTVLIADLDNHQEWHEIDPGNITFEARSGKISLAAYDVLRGDGGDILKTPIGPEYVEYYKVKRVVATEPQYLKPVKDILVKQQKEYDCGPATIAMVLNRFGDNVQLSNLTDLFLRTGKLTTKKGTDMAAVKNWLIDRGYIVLGNPYAPEGKLTLAEAKKLDPEKYVIIGSHFKAPWLNNVSHIYVITGFNANGTINIDDPAGGVPRTINTAPDYLMAVAKKTGEAKTEEVIIDPMKVTAPEPAPAALKDEENASGYELTQEEKTLTVKQANWDQIKSIIYKKSMQNSVHPSIILAMAALESDRGKSQIAKDKNNLFGLNAQDRDPYNLAWSYPTVEAGVDDVIKVFKKTYPEAWDAKYDPYLFIKIISGENKDRLSWASIKMAYFGRIVATPEWEEGIRRTLEEAK